MQSLVAQYAHPERRARGKYDRPFIIGRVTGELAHQSINFLIAEDLLNWWGLHLSQTVRPAKGENILARMAAAVLKLLVLRL